MNLKYKIGFIAGFATRSVIKTLFQADPDKLIDTIEKEIKKYRKLKNRRWKRKKESGKKRNLTLKLLRLKEFVTWESIISEEESQKQLIEN